METSSNSSCFRTLHQMTSKQPGLCLIMLQCTHLGMTKASPLLCLRSALHALYAAAALLPSPRSEVAAAEDFKNALLGALIHQLGPAGHAPPSRTGKPPASSFEACAGQISCSWGSRFCSVSQCPIPMKHTSPYLLFTHLPLL